MTLVDPTSGLGYSFGQKLPSTHMTTIATNQPKAVDGAGGGTWTPSAPIILNGASALQLGGKLKYTSRIVTRALPILPSTNTGLAGWEWASAAVGLVWQNVTTGAECLLELTKIAHNSSVTSVRAFYQGATGHAALPANKPKFRLYQISTTNVYTNVGGVVTDDPSANVAAFEAAHSVAVGIGGSFVADLTQYRYALHVLAEGGMNAVVGANFLGIELTMTITEQAEV